MKDAYLNWPSFAAVLVVHTVKNDEGVLVAGYLVRCTSSRADLGWLWPRSVSSAIWNYRSADGRTFGERSSLKSAVEVLRDVYSITHGQTLSSRPVVTRDARLPLGLDERATSIDRSRSSTPRSAPPAPVVSPAAPVRHITWGDDDSHPDLTSATAAALNRHAVPTGDSK